MNRISIQHHDTGIGELVLGSFGGRLCLLGFGGGDMRQVVDARIGKRLDADFVERDDEILQETRRQLDEYLIGVRKEFDIPLLLVGTDFQRSVWNALLQVPYGGTASYLQIARAIGREKAVRAVGNACGANPIAVIVPCHRIVGSGGRLGGYGGGLPLKERLLRMEQSNTTHTPTG
ncbi:MAG: methylated-DNA--[protein]-cysteine S-methyltransferase [Dehalococcoidia bacterium]|nr:methylated-DNA--[protein]-cysteine S-methyltransferase [Dehalococcoidia bacterium]